MLGYPNNYFFTPIFDFVDLVPYSTTQFFFKALRRKKNFIIVYLFIYLFIAFFLGHHCLCLWRPSLYMFMAAFVLSVYVYLRIRSLSCPQDSALALPCPFLRFHRPPALALLLWLCPEDTHKGGLR